MLDKVDLPPTPPLPRRWAPIIAAVLAFGLVVAFFAAPAFRRDVVTVWDAARGMVKKLFGL